MFKVNDTVVHPSMGICIVTDITKMAVGKNPAREFFVLTPKYENTGTKIYVPSDGKIELRYPLDSERIKEILKDVLNTQALWNDNDALRRAEFTEILRSGNHTKIIKLIYELHEKQKEKEKNGKKLHLSDERILREAERLIHGELAYSMQIEPENVAEYIMSVLL